jgi:hypothetical protein
LDFEIACTCGQNMIVESQLIGQDVQCPGCGGLLTVPAVPRSGDPVPVVWPKSERTPSPPPPPPTAPPPFVGGDRRPFLGRKTNGKAVASLICSIIGLATCPVGPLVLSTAGVVLGGRAKREILYNPELYDGLGLAVAGQVLGIIGLILSMGSCLITGCLGIVRGVGPF